MDNPPDVVHLDIDVNRPQTALNNAEDIQDIANIFSQYAARRKRVNLLYEFHIEKALGVTAIITAAAAPVLYLYRSFQYSSLILGLMLLSIPILIVLVEIVLIMMSFRSPLNGYANGFGERITEREECISSLSSFPIYDLLLAKASIERDVERIKNRSALLLGITEKVGLIPAGLALYNAAVHLKIGAHELESNLLLSFILGLNFGTFMAHRVIDNLNIALELIGEALRPSTN